MNTIVTLGFPGASGAGLIPSFGFVSPTTTATFDVYPDPFAATAKPRDS